MKSLITLGVAIGLSAVSLWAQGSPASKSGDQSPIAKLESYQECDFLKLEQPLLNSLEHDVEGVVVNALREVAKIKLAQPVCASSRIARQVEELVRNGATPAIRYKAYLTSIVLSTPLTFAEEGRAVFQTDEQFFTALSRKLEGLALHEGK